LRAAIVHWSSDDGRSPEHQPVQFKTQRPGNLGSPQRTPRTQSEKQERVAISEFLNVLVIVDDGTIVEDKRL
jgi:hypothetical protein